MGSTYHLFHGLEAFVAVPNKARVIDMLLRNRWLMAFLGKQITMKHKKSKYSDDSHKKQNYRNVF